MSILDLLPRRTAVGTVPPRTGLKVPLLQLYGVCKPSGYNIKVIIIIVIGEADFSSVSRRRLKSHQFFLMDVLAAHHVMVFLLLLLLFVCSFVCLFLWGVRFCCFVVVVSLVCLRSVLWFCCSCSLS